MDRNGAVVFERKLTKDAVIAAENLLTELKNEGGDGGPAVSIVGYDGDDLYTTDAESEEV